MCGKKYLYYLSKSYFQKFEFNQHLIFPKKSTETRSPKYFLKIIKTCDALRYKTAWHDWYDWK